MKKKVIIIIIVCMIIIGTCVYCFNLKDLKVRSYFNAISNKDLDYVYKTFSLPTDEFVNKDSLESYITGLNVSANNSIKSIDYNGNIVNIEYLNDGDLKTNSLSVSLEEKKFLLFSIWNIYNKILVENVEITIPSEYDLYLDNIYVDNFLQEKNIKRYTIPYLFNKEYKVTLKTDDNIIDDSFYSSRLKYVYQEQKEQELINIDYSKFVELYNASSKSIIIIGSNYCSHCIEFKLVMKKASYLYNTNVYFFDISTLTTNERSEFNKLKYIKEDFKGTPTTILVSSSNVIDSIQGYKSDVEYFFKNNGY